MNLQIIDHARRRMIERGVAEEEVRLVLEFGQATGAKAERLDKEHVFAFGGTWRGRRYAEKKVQVIYVIENHETCGDKRVCFLWQVEHMKITYDSKYDVVYLALTDKRAEVTTERISDDIALDFSSEGQLVGVEVLSASRHLDLSTLLPVTVDAA